LRNAALANFAHYAQHSTERSKLFFVKVFRGEELLGLAPIIKTVKFNGTKLLKKPARRWARPLLGLLSRKTTYMVDTAFMGFQYAVPFFCVDPADAPLVRDQVFEHLRVQQDVDHIWIAEPAGDLAWAAANGFESFNTLAAVQVSVAGHTTIDSYLDSLSKKRRKNFRQDRKPFDQHGATIEYVEPPLPRELTCQMHRCLVKSAENNARYHDLAVPFEDLQIHETAFRTQHQHALVARVDQRVIGFFSFFPNGNVIHQCHGGFDYDLSIKTKAYHNLMNAAIQFAIEHGYDTVTLGPLNNETKRRIGTEFLPVTAHLWSRERLVHIVSKKLFIPNFQVYCGPATASGGGSCDS
jgi:hypothetical protein